MKLWNVYHAIGLLIFASLCVWIFVHGWHPGLEAWAIVSACCFIAGWVVYEREVRRR